MARARKSSYSQPVESVGLGALERKLIASSPAFSMNQEETLAFLQIFAPPGSEYPMLYASKTTDENPDIYRDWLIKILEVLTDCYPAPVNMALDCLRKSLIEVNRGLTPNLFKPAKPAKGGKTNFAAQIAMNLAVLAANYIHDEVGNDDSYAEYLKLSGTSRLEIDRWRTRRIDPAYRQESIIAWYDLPSALVVLRNAISDYRKHSGRRSRSLAADEADA